MAKGLGGGFPIGAIGSTKRTKAFSTRFSWNHIWRNPLASVSGNAVIDTIFEDKLLEKVQKQSKQWHEKIHDLKTKYPDKIHDIRGKGYMVGISVDDTQAITHSCEIKDCLLCLQVTTPSAYYLH